MGASVLAWLTESSDHNGWTKGSKLRVCREAEVEAAEGVVPDGAGVATEEEGGAITVPVDTVPGEAGARETVTTVDDDAGKPMSPLLLAVCADAVKAATQTVTAKAKPPAFWSGERFDVLNDFFTRRSCVFILLGL